jgi:hypothetical protein
MKINKLKALSIAVSFLFIALLTETQGMERDKDILESTVMKNGVPIQLSVQHINDEITFNSIVAPLISLEDTTTSWATYCLSPVKKIIRNTYNLANYIVQNPQKVMIICAYLSTQILSASANTCVLYYEVPVFGNVNMTLNNIAAGNCPLCEVLCKGGFELSAQFVNGTYPCIKWTC